MRVLLSLSLILLLSSTALAQPQFGGGKFGGKYGSRDGSSSGREGGFSMMMGDPGKMFDFAAKGKPYIVIAESRMRSQLEEYAKEKGITNGQITREQYVAYFERLKGKMSSSGDGKTLKPPMGPGGEAKSGDNASGGDPIEAEFKQRDENGDGFLNTDEMSYLLRSDYKKWDTTNDDLIELKEFRAYKLALQQQQQRQSTAAENEATVVKTLPSEEELDRRPTVFRAGKLPRELPSWYAESDTDNDGQIALHEWHAKEKMLDEFRAMDRNDDGFLTAEEVLRHQTLVANGKAKTAVSGAVASSGRPAGPSMSRSSSGRPGGFDMKSFFEKFKKKE